MWMTSNFPARERSFVRLFACSAFAVFLACSTHSGFGVALAQETAPDAPRPARSSKVQPTTPGRRSQPKTVEIKSVTVGRLDGSTTKLAGVDFMRSATDPLVIEVRTEGPLGDLTRTSSPVIVLNGETLSETIPLMPNRLIAFLPNRRFIKDTNTVVVVWLGQEELTRSRRALTFRSRDIK
jgi:hypothetical protein